MKALALALCVALPAYADDVPKQLCLEPEQRIALAQQLVAKDAQIASLESSLRAAPSPALVVVLVVAGVLVGGATTYGVVKATQPR